MESAVREMVRRRKNQCVGKLPRPASRPAPRRNKAAIIWEGEPGEKRTLTYQQLHHEVCRFANVLKRNKIDKGDRVIIYLPTIPEAAIAMLACARIGAVHSVVFGGFSARQHPGPDRRQRRDRRDHGRRRLPPRRNCSAEKKCG